MNCHLSRRLFLAAGSAGAVFGALSQAVAAERKSSVAEAIEHYKEAQAAYLAALETNDDDEITPAWETMLDELANLAEAPCASAAEFVEKLKCMEAYYTAYDEETVSFNPALFAAIRNAPLGHLTF